MMTGRLTEWAMIEAEIAMRRMSHDQKVSLADEIHARQPHMLASFLALPSMGVSMAQLEVAVHILLVTFLAMKLRGHPWPLVTEEIQDGCLRHLTARARFNEVRVYELFTGLRSSWPPLEGGPSLVSRTAVDFHLALGQSGNADRFNVIHTARMGGPA